MRTAAIAGAGLIMTLLLPLLLIGALLGSIGSATASSGVASSAVIGDLSPPTPYSGRDGGCTAVDPTGGRCLSATTRHGYDEIVRTFGAPGPDSPIRSAGCWDAHAWNPDSDHPKGRACDYFPGAAGVFPAGVELDDGWRLAEWLRTHADILGVSYIIWQGRFWSPRTPDTDGWGRRYSGGGVYDPADATGGHYDHIHVSYRG